MRQWNPSVRVSVGAVEVLGLEFLLGQVRSAPRVFGPGQAHRYDRTSILSGLAIRLIHINMLGYRPFVGPVLPFCVLDLHRNCCAVDTGLG